MVTFLCILAALDVLKSVTNAAADDDRARSKRSILAMTCALPICLDELRSRSLSFRFKFIAFACFYILMRLGNSASIFIVIWNRHVDLLKLSRFLFNPLFIATQTVLTQIFCPSCIFLSFLVNFFAF